MKGKFRVWDTESKHYSDGWMLDQDGNLLYDNGLGEFSTEKEPKRYIKEFSTGLLDCEGKEI